MMVLTVIFWLILILLVLLGLVLTANVWIKLEGRWRKDLDYELLIGVGLFAVAQERLPAGKKETVIRIGQRELIRAKSRPSRPKKEIEKEKPGFKDLLPFLQGDFLRGLFRALRDILANIKKDEDTYLRGSWGFADPYYTGLMAAFLPMLPNTWVTPVFGQEYRELEFKAGLRLRLGVVTYYVLRFLFARESRQVWREIMKQRKEQKTRHKMQPSAKYGV